MNHDCCGDFFTVQGARYYCCFAGSKLIPAALVSDECPNCGRRIIAEEHGVVQVTTRIQRIVTLPGGRVITLSRQESNQ